MATRYCKNKRVIVAEDGTKHQCRCVLSCVVLVNNIVPDSKGLNKNISGYDTYVDNINNSQIYIVTRDFMAIPKYKIWFKTVVDTNTKEYHGRRIDRSKIKHWFIKEQSLKKKKHTISVRQKY